MGKIFRLHSGTTQNIEHWQQLPNYIDHNNIDTIEDPSGLSASTQITSIPTPFARLDLIKSAFLYVTANKNLEGNTIYHRMVSDTLDVAEIFFNIEAFKDKLEILEWKTGIQINNQEISIENDSDLGKLINSTNKSHKLLGETLKMFLIQDKKSFNFSNLKNVYLLNYKNGPERLNIIGGTSPTTLFFSTANNLSYVDIKIANHKFFDNTYCPLFNRTPEFIKWLYTLQQILPNFSEVFKGFNEYLDQTLLLLANDLKIQVTSITRNNALENYDSNYKNIEVASAGHFAELLGFTLKSKNYDIPVDNSSNDFIINTTKTISGSIPCILPIEAFNQELNFGGGTWHPDWYKNVPKFDSKPLQNRTLPNQPHIKYPYLTVSDLLESYIIKVPYPIDNTKFFDGNYQITNGEQDHGFILPLKREFFKYFSINDLKGVLLNGKKMFEIKKLTGGVRVILRIPIQKNNIIEYSKIYNNNAYQDSIPKPDDENNLGVVIENQFTVAIYPFVKFEEDINPHYRVLFVDRDISTLTKHNNYSVSFFKESNIENEISGIIKKVRSDKNQSPKVSTNYFVVEKNYDFIEVKHNQCGGIIIPLLEKPKVAHKKFKFAIDFGTTNTHIEYKDGDIIKPFEITEKEVQVGTLYSPNSKTDNALASPRLGIGADDLVSIIQEEFAPFKIGANEPFKFPQRTIINDNGMFNADEANFALADFNIPFWYLKEKRVINSTITPNLKWHEFNNDKKAERRTRAFLKQLMMMLRNKVIFGGGDLKETEIVWFYPSCMPTFRKNKLENAWKDFYKRYFGDNNKLFKLSESFAPFYYYSNNEGVKPNTRPAANIDIGGGTTDIVIYKGQDPIALTSFRYASNSIFGDGFGNTKRDNGFVQKYSIIIKETLSNTSAKSLIDIYEIINENTKNSIELCEFFFSLSENKLIKENKIKLSFSELLKNDDELKIVFVLFYSSIIYHLAKLMKKQALQIPEFITFSGNGAKLVSITSGSDNLTTLESITKLIFQKVYNASTELPIKLKLVNNPKEVTCKGGLEISNYNKFESLETQIFDVLVGDTSNQSVKDNNLTYNKLSDTLCVNVKNEVESFISLFFELNETINFNKTFGINLSKKDEYLTLLKENIMNDLKSGIDEKIAENAGNENDKIEESLFFYPLRGALNRLANKIYLDNK